MKDSDSIKLCLHCLEPRTKIPCGVRKRKQNWYCKREGGLVKSVYEVQVYQDDQGRKWSHGRCPECVLRYQREGYARRLAAGKKRGRASLRGKSV